MQTLPARAADALAQGRFREAIDLFKQLVRQEPRPEWKAALDDAYAGRARELAAKQMFKEAAMLLENTRAPDGALRDPLLYAKCLIREGQQAKAAAHLLQAVCGSALPANDRPDVEALLAALLTVVSLPPAAVATDSPERARWRENAAAARQALAAWVDGAPAEEVEKLLSRISLRSAFRPLRLLLKTLLAGPDAAEKSRSLLETIAPYSPFFPLRQAVEAALGAGFSPDGWSGLAPPQRRFVAETAGIPEPTVEALEQLSQAAATSPESLFAALLKRAANLRHGLDPSDLRSACLNLLPQLPGRIGQFEKQFGQLSPLERARAEALAAEAKENWGAAEMSWAQAAIAIGKQDSAERARLQCAVIYRHLAKLAAKYREIRGTDEETDPVVDYLARADKADPNHVPTVLARLARLRCISRDKEWHRLADEAAQRFPQDSQVLLQATESAVARQAHKKAAGYAQRLLAIDPINPGLRRQMVELQVSYARKQLREKRADLAARGLDEAAQWERADSPNAVLRIYRGLVALQEGKKEEAETLLRQGAEMAGGGVAGWFRVMLETMLTKIKVAAWVSDELSLARKTPPAKQAVQAVVSALGAPEAIAAKRALTGGLLVDTKRWLDKAAGLDWSLAEFQALEETLIKYEFFPVLHDFARAGRQREPGNTMWRFHEILARTCNDHRRMTMVEEDDLDAIGQAASDRNDAHAMARLRLYLDMNETMEDRMNADFDDSPEINDPDDLLNMLKQMQGLLPKDLERGIRAKVGESGREATIAELAKEFAAGPDGLPLPKAIARQIAEFMVDAAIKGKARPGRVGRF
jgi:tetratricopeptide (TPR) repeat protein